MRVDEGRHSRSLSRYDQNELGTRVAGEGGMILLDNSDPRSALRLRMEEKEKIRTKKSAKVKRRDEQKQTRKMVVVYPLYRVVRSLFRCCFFPHSPKTAFVFVFAKKKNIYIY